MCILTAIAMAVMVIIVVLVVAPMTVDPGADPLNARDYFVSDPEAAEIDYTPDGPVVRESSADIYLPCEFKGAQGYRYKEWCIKN